jgi:hypothetical protein
MSLPGVARRRRALGLIAGGIAAVLVGFGVLQAQAMRASSAGEVARALERELGLRARVGRTQLAPLTLELVAHDVALDGRHGPVLRARELHVRPSLGALLRGRVDLRALELRSAVLTVREADLAGVALVPERGWPFSTLTAKGSRVSWQSAALGTVELERADVALQASGKTLRARITAPAGAFARDGARHALSRIDLQAAIDPQALRLERASLHAQGVRIAARAASFPAPLGSRASAQLELEADLARAAQLGLLRGLPALLGRAYASGKIAISERDVALDGKLRLERVQIAGRALGERVELQLRGGGRDGLVLSGVLPIAGASGGLAFSASPRLDADGLRLEALLVRSGQSDLRGRAALTRAGTLALSLIGERASLPELAPLLGPDLGNARLRGQGRVQLSTDGPLGELSPRIALQVDGFGVGDRELGKLDAALVLSEGGRVLQFERAALQGPGRALGAEALRLTVQDGLAEASARVKIGQLPLLDLYRLLGAEHDPLLSGLQGSARGSAEIEYARAGAEQLTLALELQEASLDGYRFDGGRLRAKLTSAGIAPALGGGATSAPDAKRGLAAGTIALSELVLRAGGGALKLHGEVASGGALDLAVALERLPIARLPWIRQHAPALAGQLAGSGRLTGTRAEPRAELDLTGDGVAWDGEPLGRLRLRAELRRRGDGEARALAACNAGRKALAGGALRGDSAWLLCGQGFADRARIDLAIGNGAGAPVRGELQLERLDLAPFLPELRAGRRMRGELDATLQIADASLAAPAQMTGALAVRRLQLGQGDFALKSGGPFEVAVARGAVELAGIALTAPKARLELSAGGNLKQGAELTVAGKASADLLTPLLPGAAELYGDMDVRLQLGLGAGHKLKGHAALQDGYARLDSGAFLRKLGGKLLLEGQRVRVQEASAAFGGGVLRTGGTLELRGARVVAYDLELAADQVAFEPQDRFTVAFDASGGLRWAEGGPAPKLSGKVKLQKLVYGRHVQLPDAVIAFNRDERAQKYDPARDRVLFDVQVEHEQPLVIRNNFLDAEVALVGSPRTLRVTGSDQRLGLLGKLQVLRGRVLYRGDEFKITRGAIAFDDPSSVAPDFEVRAVAEKRKRPGSTILLWTRGNRHSFDLQVRCEASGGEPPPFTCDFRDNRLRCDSFNDLMRLWVCQPEAELSRVP